jgi:hypothetical protein
MILKCLSAGVVSARQYQQPLPTQSFNILQPGWVKLSGNTEPLERSLS